MIGAAASVAAGLGLSLLSGAALLAALCGGVASTRSLPLRLALSWGLGAALTAWSVWLLGWAGHSPGVASVGATLIAVPACALLATRRARRARGTEAPGPAGTPRAGGSRGAWPERAAVLLLLGAAAGLVLLTAALSIDLGARASDAHSIWLLKARVAYLDGGFDGLYWQHWPDGHDRRGYPPLVSLLGAWVYLLAGRLDDGLVKLVFVGFETALLALVYDVLARRLPRWAAALATLFCAGTGMSIVLTVWGVADLPLAFFILAALHLLELAGGRGVWAAGLLLAAAAFTKLEGSVAALLVAGAGGLAAARGGRWRAAISLAAPPALVMLLWAHFTSQRGIPLLVGPSAEAPEGAAGLATRMATCAAGLLECSLRAGWLFTWPLFALALAQLAWRRAPAGLLRWAAVVLAMLAADALVLAVQGGDLRWLIATTGPRLLYQVFPVAFAVTVIALGVSAPARTSRGPGA